MCRAIEIERSGKLIRVCSRTKLPLTMDTPFGEFCEKECDLDAMVFAKQKTAFLMDAMGDIMTTTSRKYKCDETCED